MGWPEDAVVVVTGAASGIGLAVAEWYVERGARVFGLDLRTSDGLEQAVRRPAEAARRGAWVAADVSSGASLDAAVGTVLASAGSIDALVAAAGLAEPDTAAEEMTEEVWARTIGVNLTGVFLSCQRVGRVMLAQGHGRVVAIASMSGQHVVNVPQRQVAYNASKAGVVAMVKSLALEWVGRGVRVNVVSPGYVDTPLLAGRADLHAGWTGLTPAGRFATPQEVAAAVGYLLGDDAGFCVGTELLVDGGYALP